jgi:hypothetical protein
MANALMQRPWNFEVANAGNFTQPVMQGIEAGMRDRQQGVENERQNKLMGFQEQRLGMEKAKADRDAEAAEAHQFGKTMSALASAPPEFVAQYAPQIFAKHPKYAAKFAEYGIPMDKPHIAVKMLAQQYGDYDPIAIEKNRAAIEASRASAAANAATAKREAELHPLNLGLKQAQINQANQKDEMGGLITGMVRGAIAPPAAAPPPGQPMLQQQSMEGAPQGDPNLVRVQAPPGQPPQQPPPQAAPGVGSMFDGKTPQEKRRIGEALLLDPRTKALGEQLMKDTDKDLTQLGKPAINDVDEKIVAGLDQLARLEAMNQTFEDKYQTIGTRIGMAGAGWMAKIDPSRVDPKTAQDLAAFAKDRRRGIENLNLTIKDITGAAMSNPEAARIMQQVPNPGTGIFDGDDPITYRAKMKDATDQTRLAVARRAWLKKNNPELLARLSANKMEGVEAVMPLDRMRDTMNQRKNEIYQGLKQRNPNATREQLLPYVGQMLNQEFGI